MPFLGDGLHGVLQYTVNAILHGHFGVAGFDVDVAGAALQRGEDNSFDQFDDGTSGSIASQADA